MKRKLFIFLLFVTVFSGFSQNDSTYLKGLLDKGYDYEKVNLDSALLMYTKIYSVAKKKKLPFFAGKSTQYKGIVYNTLGKYDSAIFYLKKSKQYFNQKDQIADIAKTNLNIGNSYFYKADYSSAIEYYLETESQFESINDLKSLGAVLSNLGAIYSTIERFEDAKKYTKKGLAVSKKNKDSTAIILDYYNLANNYLDETKLDSVFILIKEAELYINNNISLHSQYLFNYLKGQYYSEIKDYPIAEDYSAKALEIQKKINNPYNLPYAYVLVSEIQIARKRFKQAEKNMLEALKINENNNDIIMGCHSLLSDIYKNMNLNAKALYHKDLQYQYYDSILGNNQREAINSLDIKYKSEKKDKEIAQQQLMLEKQQNELQKKNTQYSIMTGIAIFLLVASLLGWFLYQQRQKRKNQEILTLKREQQVKTLESLMAGEEKERFRIAKELHDGVNGDLSAIKYKLTSMLEHNTTVVNEVVAMIDKSSEQVRAISHNLVPPSLEKFNLKEALEDYCAKMNEVHEPQLSYQHIGEHMAISKNNEINIYRIVQELVSNSLKHSEGNKITVQTSLRENTLQITVEDNGKGFDPSKVTSKGIGLSNIDSRIAYLKATKDLISNAQGTSFTIEIDTTN